MKKYIIVKWPEVKAFTRYPEYLDSCFLCTPLNDSTEHAWAIPEELYNKHYERN